MGNQWGLSPEVLFGDQNDLGGIDLTDRVIDSGFLIESETDRQLLSFTAGVDNSDHPAFLQPSEGPDQSEWSLGGFPRLRWHAVAGNIIPDLHDPNTKTALTALGALGLAAGAQIMFPKQAAAEKFFKEQPVAIAKADQDIHFLDLLSQQNVEVIEIQPGKCPDIPEMCRIPDSEVQFKTGPCPDNMLGAKTVIIRSDLSPDLEKQLEKHNVKEEDELCVFDLPTERAVVFLCQPNAKASLKEGNIQCGVDKDNAVYIDKGFLKPGSRSTNAVLRPKIPYQQAMVDIMETQQQFDGYNDYYIQQKPQASLLAKIGLGVVGTAAGAVALALGKKLVDRVFHRGPAARNAFRRSRRVNLGGQPWHQRALHGISAAGEKVERVVGQWLTKFLIRIR